MKKYTFYVGLDESHVDPAHRRHLSVDHAIGMALTQAAFYFGGATVKPTHGACGTDGFTIFEDGFVVETFLQASNPEGRDLFAKWCRATFQQREILVVDENVTAFFSS